MRLWRDAAPARESAIKSSALQSPMRSFKLMLLCLLRWQSHLLLQMR